MIYTPSSKKCLHFSYLYYNWHYVYKSEPVFNACFIFNCLDYLWSSIFLHVLNDLFVFFRDLETLSLLRDLKFLTLWRMSMSFAHSYVFLSLLICRNILRVEILVHYIPTMMYIFPRVVCFSLSSSTLPIWRFPCQKIIGWGGHLAQFVGAWCW